jgi:hypothetical protein
VRKRSKYRPKGVILDPINHVLSGLKRVGSISEGVTLMIKNHTALEAVRKGVGTREDIDVLIGALNMTEALAFFKFGDDWADEIRAAQDALLELGRRGAETGKFILRGPELTALNVGMEIHDAQLQACTVIDLEKAMDYVTQCLRNGKARSMVRKEKDEIKAETTD